MSLSPPKQPKVPKNMTKQPSAWSNMTKWARVSNDNTNQDTEIDRRTPHTTKDLDRAGRTILSLRSKSQAVSLIQSTRLQTGLDDPILYIEGHPDGDKITGLFFIDSLIFRAVDKMPKAITLHHFCSLKPPNDIGNRNARGQVYEAGYQAIQGMMRNLIVQLLLKYPFSLDSITREVREFQGARPLNDLCVLFRTLMRGLDASVKPVIIIDNAGFCEKYEHLGRNMQRAMEVLWYGAMVSKATRKILITTTGPTAFVRREFGSKERYTFPTEPELVSPKLFEREVATFKAQLAGRFTRHQVAEAPPTDEEATGPNGKK